MQCELCGRDCDCRPGVVDGVRMMLCPGCLRHGKEVKTSSEAPAGTQIKLNLQSDMRKLPSGRTSGGSTI